MDLMAREYAADGVQVKRVCHQHIEGVGWNANNASFVDLANGSVDCALVGSLRVYFYEVSCHSARELCLPWR